MKKLLIGILSIGLFFASCSRKMDYDFDSRPDARIKLKIDEYEDLLTSAPNGWIGYLYPSGGGGFTFKFKFKENEQVEMVATLNDESSKTPKTTIWSLRSPQIPSLYFDTYSYIHELADPAVTKYGGTYSIGAGGDFEFGFIKVSEDTIRLKGNFRGSDLILVKAKSDQGDDYIEKSYDFVKNKLGQIERFKYYHKKLVVNGKDYAITINTDKSTVNIWHQTDTGLNSFSTEFAAATSGIMLRNEFVDKDFKISSFSDLVVDLPNGKASLKINGSQNAEIVQSQTPIVIDPNAPIVLFNNYSKTYTHWGFNYDGKRDYFDLAAESNLQGAYFKQRYYIDNYDVMYYDFLSGGASVRYISVMRGNINTPNVIKYNVYNMNGTNPGGTLATKINNIRSWIADSQGFYVYPTGDGFYDLVSVADSKAWIRLY